MTPATEKALFNNLIMNFQKQTMVSGLITDTPVHLLTRVTEGW
jgi:hypothetical protein